MLVNYLKIAGRLLGKHVANKGANISDSEYGELWKTALKEYFASEPLSDGARKALSDLNLEETKLQFTKGSYSYQKFVTLCRETLDAHQH